MGMTALVCSRLTTSDTAYVPPTQNPLAILSALKLGFFLSVMLVFVSIAQRFLGPHWVYLVTFLGALIEIRGVIMAIATLHLIAKLQTAQAVTLIILALTSTFLTKFLIVWTVGSKRFAFYTSGLLLSMVILMIAAWVTQMSFF